MRLKHERKSLAKSHKAVYLVVAVFCIILGFVGLILPIIPGLLFLLAAVYCLGKVSRRFGNWTERQPALQKFHANIERFDRAAVLNRVRVVALVSVNMVLASLAYFAKILKRGTRVFT